MPRRPFVPLSLSSQATSDCLRRMAGEGRGRGRWTGWAPWRSRAKSSALAWATNKLAPARCERGSASGPPDASTPPNVRRPDKLEAPRTYRVAPQGTTVRRGPGLAVTGCYRPTVVGGRTSTACCVVARNIRTTTSCTHTTCRRCSRSARVCREAVRRALVQVSSLASTSGGPARLPLLADGATQEEPGDIYTVGAGFLLRTCVRCLA